MKFVLDPTSPTGVSIANSTTIITGGGSSSSGGGGAVDSVNSKTGVVVLDADDIDDTSTTNKFTNSSDISKLSGIEALADVTDSTNVAAAGATMNTDTSLSGNSYFLDEDDMASNSNAKVPSQQSTKAYVDDAVTVTEMTGAAPYRSKYLDQWFAKLEDSNESGPLNILIVGDSISAGASGDSPTARGWGWIMSDLFARKDYKARYSPSPAVPQISPDGYAPALSPWGKTMTTCEGTVTNTGVGRYSSTMTNGQVATQTAFMDAVSVIYNTHTDGGLIEVRDGPGGTLLATIDTAGTAKGGQMWTSDALDYQSHTIHLTAVCTGGQTVILNGVYSYSGNLTKGIRVWVSGRAGINTATATSDTTFFLDFIDTIDPDLVVLATGANDTTATYTSRMQDMIDATRLRTSADIALWGCYPISFSDKYIDEQAVLARQMALDNNIQIIDAFLALPDMRQAGYFRDGLHPNDKGVKAIAYHAYSILAGDPLAFSIREIAGKAEQTSLDTTNSTITSLTTTVNGKAPKADPTFTGTVSFPNGSIANGLISGLGLNLNNGNVNVNDLFTYLQFALRHTGDAHARIGFASNTFNNFLYGINYNGVTLGPGNVSPDTGIFYHSAGRSLIYGGLAGTRIDPRVSSAASGDISPDVSAADMYVRTALAATCEIAAPTGTPANGNRLVFKLKDDGTARTLDWNATFVELGVTIPTTTVIGKWVRVEAEYNTAATRWEVIDVRQEA